MRNNATSRTNQLEFRGGGGWLMLLGLPFLVSGVVAGTSPIWGPLKTKQGTPMPLIVAILLGLVFCGVGFAFIFGRAGHILDRQLGVVTSWWGLLIPFRTKMRPLGDFHQVRIAREVRRSSKSSYTVYPVYLTATQGTDIALQQPRDSVVARQVGEDAARFLGMKLVDVTLGEPLVRQPEELDESLRERAMRSGQFVEAGPPPEGCRVVYRVEDDALVLDLPPSGMTTTNRLRLMVGVGAPLVSMAIFVAVMAFSKLPWEMWLFIGVGLGAMFGLPMLFVLLSTLRSSFAKTTVRITPEALSVRRAGTMRNVNAAINIDELEELTIVSGHALPGRTGRGRPPVRFFMQPDERIIARSDRASVSFGEGLSRPELEWLKALVQNAVTA